MLVITPSNNKYKLSQSFTYKEHVVPSGFESDGTTAPRIFRLFVSKYSPKYIQAVVVHDYLCSLKKYKAADGVFKEMLYAIDKNWKTRLMVNAVKFYTKVFR